MHVGVLVCTNSTPRNSLRGNNYKRKKAEFINHARNTPIQPLLPRRMLPKHRSYEAHKNVSTDGQMGGWTPGVEG